jgi:regulator of cell morphogenesis and NO signaling
MINIAQQTLAGIVINDHRAAAILEKYSLDFCCKGKRTLADACAEKGFSAEEISAELESINEPGNSRQMPFVDMTAEQLIAHIVIHHHFYVKQIMPQLFTHLEKVAIKHGDRFPEMIQVFHLFAEIRKEMTLHMQKEEVILFPAIKKAERAFVNKENTGAEAAIINGAVNVMENEHDSAGEIMFKIRELTGNYHEPVGACTTFKLSLAELKAFEEDLHHHVHLENNILFPMAKRFVE